MILFQGCEVFAPEALGQRDVLVAGRAVEAISEGLEAPRGLEVDLIDARGLRMAPGLIDAHVHIAGAGGEGGPGSRTPELRLSQLWEGGITSVVGCLGTDGFTRTVESVLMKAKSLRAEGASAYLLTGAYQVPTPTILGDVGRDLALIEEVIGVGEVAVADHRSSGPTTDELIRLAEHARVGGMLGGKAGIVTLHMGDERDPFRQLREAVAMSALKPTAFLPTHCNRNAWIIEDAKQWGREGYVDITTSSWAFFQDEEVKPSRAVRELVEAGVPWAHLTMTSDGCGSLPSFDSKGHLVRLLTGEPRTLLTEMLDLVRVEGIPLEQALTVVTSNVADIFKLGRKGRIRRGLDADLVLLDAQDRVVHLVASGVLVVRDGEIRKKGTFES